MGTDENAFDGNIFSVLETHDDENAGNPTDDYDGLVSRKGGSTANLKFRAKINTAWETSETIRVCLVQSNGTQHLGCAQVNEEDEPAELNFEIDYDIANLGEGTHSFYLVAHHKLVDNPVWVPQFRTHEFQITFDDTPPTIDFSEVFGGRVLLRRDQLGEHNQFSGHITFSEQLYDNDREPRFEIEGGGIGAEVVDFYRGAETERARLDLQFEIANPDRDVSTKFRIRSVGQYDLAGNQYRDVEHAIIYDAGPPEAAVRFVPALREAEPARRVMREFTALTFEVTFDQPMDTQIRPMLHFRDPNGNPVDMSKVIEEPDKRGTWINRKEYKTTYRLKWDEPFIQIGSLDAPISVTVNLEKGAYNKGDPPPIRDGVEDEDFFFDAHGVGAVPPTNVASYFYVEGPSGLTVHLTGTGIGSVESDNPFGLQTPIHCTKSEPSDVTCSSPADVGTEVRLTAQPGGDSGFVGWTGCDKVDDNDPLVCIQTIGAPETVQANFANRTETAGTLVIAKRIEPSKAGDHTFEFTGDPPISNLTLSTVNGLASSAYGRVDAGSYRVTELTDDHNWLLIAIECLGDTDGGSLVDLGARSVDIDLDANEEIVCTFVSRRVETDRTSRIIRNFMVRRAEQIVANEPDLAKRLQGNQSTSLRGSLSGFDQVQLGYTADLETPASDACPPWHFGAWSEGRFTRIKDEGGAEQDLAILNASVDRRINQDLVVGMLGQFDWASESNDVEGYDIEGFGWMIGPYMVASLHHNTVFDARFAAGQSHNRVNPIGRYEDRFRGDRWLIRSALTGDFHDGVWRVRPHVRAVYFQETQRSYFDSLNNRIPSQTVSLGQVDFGPQVSASFDLADNWTFAPYLSLTGVWTFAATGTVDLETGHAAVSGNGLHARIEGGFSMEVEDRLLVQVSAFLGGIGQTGRDTYGGTFKARLLF